MKGPCELPILCAIEVFLPRTQKMASLYFIGMEAPLLSSFWSSHFAAAKCEHLCTGTMFEAGRRLAGLKIFPRGKSKRKGIKKDETNPPGKSFSQLLTLFFLAPQLKRLSSFISRLNPWESKVLFYFPLFHVKVGTYISKFMIQMITKDKSFNIRG